MKKKGCENSHSLGVKLLSISCVFLFAVTASGQNSSISTVPVGYCTIEIAAGTGVAKRNSLVSVPLLSIDPTLPSRGTVVGIKNRSTLNVAPSDKGLEGLESWPPGSLSRPSSPYLLQLTSGAGEGRMFLISTTSPNSSTEITLTDPHVDTLDLVSEGVSAGDTFKIYACDTLLSFFGRPEDSGVQGGATFREADSVVILNNGAASTYFYSTSLGRWTRVALGSPDASHTPLLPYYGLQYSRIAPTPLKLVALGEVPAGKRKVPIRKSGSTILSTYWPSGQKLIDSGLHTTRGWNAWSPTVTGDRLTLTENGSASTHRYDGAGWRRATVGNPLSNDTILPGAGACMIFRRGDNISSPVYLTQDAPYNL
jgi:hypothetical protein